MMDINRIVQDLVDSRFRDLAGLRISATVPVKDTLINELVGKVLAAAASPSPAAATRPATAAPAAPAAESPASAAPASQPPGLPGGLRIDPSHLVPLIRKAVVRAEQGRIVLDVEIAID